jgi:hypothetical protein
MGNIITTHIPLGDRSPRARDEEESAGGEKRWLARQADATLERGASGKITGRIHRGGAPRIGYDRPRPGPSA